MNLWDKYNSVIDKLIKAKEDEKLATLRHITNLIDEKKINLVDNEFNAINWREQEYFESDPEKVIMDSIEGIFQLIKLMVGETYLTPENKALIKQTLETDIEKHKNSPVMEYYYLGAAISKLIQTSMETRAKKHVSDK